jgi:hypothetical protein
MNIVEGIFLIGAGLGVMAFGLLIFYAILPLFYGLVGLAVGYWLGEAIASLLPITSGWLPLVLAIGGAVGLGLVSYLVEPFRRGLLGIGLGASVGFAIAQALGLNPVISMLVALIGCLVGIPLVLWAFDPVVIVASAIAGGAAVLDGVHLIAPLNILDRSLILSSGRAIPLLLWLTFAVMGALWQFRSLAVWRETHPALGGGE